MAQVPEIRDANTDQQDRGLEAALVVDRDSAARLGVSVLAVDETLNDAFGQRPVSTMYKGLNQYRVVLEVSPEFQESPAALRDVYVKSASGPLVPLSAFARYETRPAPLAVNHQGQFPSITLSFNLAPGASLGAAVDHIQAAQREIGLPADVHASFQGTAQAFEASLATQPLLILAALVAVYIVLGVLYESYIHPVTILSTLPSAGVGALLALLMFKADLNVIALIGILLLIGIVKKNAILMIDFAIQAERREGRSPEAAIHEACLLRFRPILMTTFAALLGALPLVIASGTGSELRRPLGITIVGGLLVSQLLTLFTTPVVYLYMDRLQARVQGAAAAEPPGRHGLSYPHRRRIEPMRHSLAVVALSALALASALPAAAGTRVYVQIGPPAAVVETHVGGAERASRLDRRLPPLGRQGLRLGAGPLGAAAGAPPRVGARPLGPRAPRLLLDRATGGRSGTPTPGSRGL